MGLERHNTRQSCRQGHLSLYLSVYPTVDSFVSTLQTVNVAQVRQGLESNRRINR